jgi:hypothetical protein
MAFRFLNQLPNLSAILLFVCLLTACATSERLNSSQSSRYEGFIRDGQTTKSQVEAQLGHPRAVFEEGRVLTYRVYLQDDGRMNLQGKGDCHACVLAFGEDGVLERHSLIKNGCR